MTFQISDLRQRPDFFDTVADRVWRAPIEKNVGDHDQIVYVMDGRPPSP